MNEIAVSKTGWVMCFRTMVASQATAKPAAAPPTAATRKPAATSNALTLVAIATSPTRTQVMAVASFSRDSPSRIVISRLGRPTRRAIVVAATASGGATTAPKANASANGTGRMSQVIRPIPRAVTMMSSTDR